jgi:hypothetical protein
MQKLIRTRGTLQRAGRAYSPQRAKGLGASSQRTQTCSTSGQYDPSTRAMSPQPASGAVAATPALAAEAAVTAAAGRARGSALAGAAARAEASDGARVALGAGRVASAPAPANKA